MSDLKKGSEIQEIFLVESDDSSSGAQNSDVTIQSVIQEIGKASASEQFENVADGNKAVITNCNNAPETLQNNEIGQEGMAGSPMPHESVQAPIDELPRNNETKEDIAPPAPPQPSKRPCRRSTRGISINDGASEETVPRRSSRIKDQNDANPRCEGLQATYAFLGKRPLYLDNKRDEYAWYLPDYSDEEDDEWK